MASYDDRHSDTASRPEFDTGAAVPDKRKRKGSGKSSLVGQTWIALILAGVLGIILLIFILQNLQDVELDLLFWTFSLPLGVTILLSVIVGGLVMALVGGVRILQLRRAAARAAIYND